MIKCVLFGHEPSREPRIIEFDRNSGLDISFGASIYDVKVRGLCCRCGVSCERTYGINGDAAWLICLRDKQRKALERAREADKARGEAAPAPEQPTAAPAAQAPAPQVNLDPVLSALNDVAQALLGQGTSTQQAVANIQQLLLSMAQQRI
jgi:hypothetical protein